MSGVGRRSLVLGFAGAVVLLLGLLWLVNAGRVGGALARADPSLLGLTGALALLWLAAWGLTLRAVLGSLDVRVPVATSFLVYAAAVFTNNVTPFGQAGGEPVSALLISKATDTRYETGLVAIASVDVLNVVSSIALMTLGVSVHASSFALGSGVYVALGSVLGSATVLLVAFTLVRRYRERFIERTAGVVARAFAALRRVPIGSQPPSRADVADRMRGFFRNVERVAADRRGLAVALSLSALGWVLQAVALVGAFAALGRTLPLSVALFVIPLAYLAGATPLPGGLGGIEAAFVGLLVPTTGIEAAVVTAGVLVFRIAVYWLPLVLGGASATVYGVGVVSQ